MSSERNPFMLHVNIFRWHIGHECEEDGWWKCFKINVGLLDMAKCVSCIRSISIFRERASFARDDSLKCDLMPRKFVEVILVALMF